MTRMRRDPQMARMTQMIKGPDDRQSLRASGPQDLGERETGAPVKVIRLATLSLRAGADSLSSFTA
jgi:hypothetical protein